MCELWLKGLRALKLSRMELVRNDDLTFSALKILVELPSIILTGKFRLSVKYYKHRDDLKCTLPETMSTYSASFMPKTVKEQLMPTCRE